MEIIIDNKMLKSSLSIMHNIVPQAKFQISSQNIIISGYNMNNSVYISIKIPKEQFEVHGDNLDSIIDVSLEVDRLFKTSKIFDDSIKCKVALLEKNNQIEFDFRSNSNSKVLFPLIDLNTLPKLPNYEFDLEFGISQSSFLESLIVCRTVSSVSSLLYLDNDIFVRSIDGNHKSNSVLDVIEKRTKVSKSESTFDLNMLIQFVESLNSFSINNLQIKTGNSQPILINSSNDEKIYVKYYQGSRVD